MEMRAKGVLNIDVSRNAHKDEVIVADGFHVLQEGKPSPTVDVAFLHRPLRLAGQFHDTSATDLSRTAASATGNTRFADLEPPPPQVTRWAPQELRDQFAFVDCGAGRRLGRRE